MAESMLTKLQSSLGRGQWFCGGQTNDHVHFRYDSNGQASTAEVPQLFADVKHSSLRHRDRTVMAEERRTKERHLMVTVSMGMPKVDRCRTGSNSTGATMRHGFRTQGSRSTMADRLCRIPGSATKFSFRHGPRFSGNVFDPLMALLETFTWRNFISKGLAGCRWTLLSGNGQKQLFVRDMDLDGRFEK